MKTPKSKNLETKKNTQQITPPKNMFNNVFFWVFLGIMAIFLLNTSPFAKSTSKQKPLSDIIKLIKEEKVQDLTVSGDNIDVLLKDGTSYTTKKESGDTLIKVLADNNTDVSKLGGKLEVKAPIPWDQVVTTLLYLVVPAIFIFIFFKQIKGANGDIMSFSRARARLFNKETATKVSFSDVAGNKESKQDLMEIVDFLKNPQKYRKLGARIPRGVLLVGPSGVGKTLLAKAVAGEANVPFYSAAGSEFMEMLVGVGSSRVRDLFKQARDTQPSLIFIDEIDAIGRQRGLGISGGHDEREQTLNQILIEMDGFDTRTNVIVLAATNRPDMLDAALVRAGRFDRRVVVPLPDLDDRKEIISLYMKNKKMAENIDVLKIARKTVGFSGADLENMLNEAAILAARNAHDEISEKDVDEASLKVTMGSERRMIQSDEEKKLTAYHEAGHALVATYSKEMDPVQRISIIPRGGSLGHTSLPPERDRYGETKTRLMSLIATMLGGRVSEEIVFNESTTGASDDINRATDIARNMVVKYGMSKLGPIAYDVSPSQNWWQKESGEQSGVSESLKTQIDQEIKNIIESAFEQAKQILNSHRHQLDVISIKLLEKETLDGDEFTQLLNENK